VATDFAIDYTTGDLIVGPDGSFALRTGPGTVEQRIWIRLRAIQGEWRLDPTNGTFGSRLREVFRLPVFRSIPEAELVIREAVAPMDDITVQDVTVAIDPDDNTAIKATITYVINDEDGGGELETLDLAFAAVI